MFSQRKCAILIALVLVIALSIPTSASITLNGSVKSTIKYEKNDKKFTPTMTFTITPATINTSDPNKAYVKFEALWSGDIDWLSNNKDTSMSNNPRVDFTSYIQFKGVYTTGGPEITTKIGYLGRIEDLYTDSDETTDYRWLPDVTKYMDGISITGGKIINADLDLYYINPEVDNNYIAATLKKQQFVNKFAYRLDDKTYRYTIDISKYPLTPDTKVYGYIDYNQFAGAGNEKSWKIGAEIKASQDALFDGYYRYNSTYDLKGIFNLDAGELKPVVEVGYKDVIIDDKHVDGVYADVITDVAEGIKLGVKYDDTVKTTNLVAGNMYSKVDDFIVFIANASDKGQLELDNGYGAVLTVVKGGTTKTFNAGITQDLIELLNLSMKGKLYARAGAKINLNDSSDYETWGQLYGVTEVMSLPGFSKITVHGRIHVSNKSTDNKYGVGATYTAPNGVVFRAGYNWKLGKGYDNVKEYVAKDAGFIIDASKTISF